MLTLNDKNILLIITGSIAAYKSALLTRLLVKAGANVRIVMTPAATAFITPLTLSTLSKNKVLIDMMDEGEWNSHVDLGLWADLVLFAPATANTMAKMVCGIADNLALTTFLSAKCPVALAPAMDLDMWKHPVTQENVKKLEQLDVGIIPVEAGELASGLRGEGRMAEPEHILHYVEDFFLKKKSGELKDKSILITAGPTYEAIDPVRFIGNHSSGKMGVSMAIECARRGARVSLVLGPSSVSVPEIIETIRVTSAAEMADAALSRAPGADAVILAAAVADFTPVKKSARKIKKGEGNLTLVLERTLDIAATIGKSKKMGQLLIGFALETDHALENARNKLVRKNFDFIVLNSLEDSGAGFRHDTNKISILYPDNKIEKFELKPKTLVAGDIVDRLAVLLHHRAAEEK
jgi:phosphopantothenoylcysteine decarboxylase/phosphopantothenate--cysteine ligase